MGILLIFAPLISFVAISLFGRLIGDLGAALVSVALMCIAWALSVWGVYCSLTSGEIASIYFFRWIESDLLGIFWEFSFDRLTLIMLIVVNTVSLLVHIYSIGYMQGDPSFVRFMSYLSLFTFFMLMLVTSNNLVQLFFGWEGVGLASYLLINFWYTRIEANKSAMKAIIVNRVADFALAIGIFYIYHVFKSLDFNVIFSCIPHMYLDSSYFGFVTLNSIDVIGVLLFIGAVGKSAQISLYMWLPDAMEGPTPVSALIHAATMVTAGVFLVLRFSPLFECTPVSLFIITLVGGSTAFFAASIGVLQHDLKKIIAYSTCSQLGYMIFACGISGYSVGIFHLMNHAFFKALLFLTGGIIIHALSDEQDIRKMGGLVQLIPFTYTMMLIGSLALMGFPFLTGYYSKDVILELSFSKYRVEADFSYWLGTISAFFTAFYSIRLIYLAFVSNPNGHKVRYEGVHDANFIMGLPLAILCFGAVFVGYTFKDMCIGIGTDFWGNAIFIHPKNYSYYDAEFISHAAKLMPVTFSLIGAMAAFCLNYLFYTVTYRFSLYNTFGRHLFKFISREWYFNNVYNMYIVLPVLTTSYSVIFKVIDRGYIEYMGPLGVTKGLNPLIKNTAELQTGNVSNYAFYMLIIPTSISIIYLLVLLCNIASHTF